MSVFDLRKWLDDAESAAQLQVVFGADPYLEIGAASQLNYRRKSPKALLFDQIKGHRSGLRVLTGSVSNPRLMGLTLGLGSDMDDLALVEALRGKPKQWLDSVPDFGAYEVPDGPIFENRLPKNEINFLDFPSPKWHEGDGGLYIGTGCAVVTVDPDTGVLNMGAYRIQVQDEGASVTINIEAGKHGAQHVRRWFEKEGRAPVAVTLGQHPIFLMVAGTEVPFGISEMDYAGAMLGEKVPYVRLPETNLPIPAESEFAFEGWLYPDRTRQEGPFGEWTGYYSGDVKPILAAEVTGLYHRNDPINLGSPPGKPPHDYSYMRSVMKSAMATDGLSGTGLAGVKGVWCHEAGGGRSIIAVALEQRYPGHSRQAGYMAAQHPVTAYMNRMVIVVDSDINPRDLDEVMWAVSTRCDPQRDIEIMRYSWGSRVDPLRLAEDPPYNSRVLMDACRPFERLGDFPEVADSSDEILRKVAKLWPELAD